MIFVKIKIKCEKSNFCFMCFEGNEIVVLLPLCYICALNSAIKDHSIQLNVDLFEN